MGGRGESGGHGWLILGFERTLMTSRFLAGLGAFAALALSSNATAQKQTAAKRSLTHADYDSWRSISTPQLSRDGKALVYGFMPQEADGDLVIRDLKTGKERREAAGTLPPPPLPDPDANPDAPVPQRNLRIAITSDNRFVVSSTYPAKADTDKAKREKRKAEEMPKGGLVVVDLATPGAAVRIADVKSYQVPSRGGAWVAYLKEAPSGAGRPAGASTLAGTSAGSAASPRKDYGTELVLRDLATGKEQPFANVTEYSFARDGKTLIYAVSSRTETDNGVFSVDVGASSAPVKLIAGPGKYSKLVFDRSQTQAAFVSDRDDNASKAPVSKVYLWSRGSAAAREIVSRTSAGFPQTLAVTDKGTLAFSRDGKKLYVPASLPPKAPRDETNDPPSDERVVMDLWHWKDPLIQPMQRIRAAQERNRTYRGSLDIGTGSYVQLADPSLSQVTLSDDGSRALGLDESPYRTMTDYDGTYVDVLLVDTRTGARKKVVEKLRGGGGFGGGPLNWSPSGKYAAYFSNNEWWILDTASGASTNATGALSAQFHDEEDDTPDPATAYGSAGWTQDGTSFLVYDRYDVWQLFADGRPAKNVTAGDGRKTKNAFRYQRVEVEEEGEEERGIDPTKPLFLRGESEETHATGFYRASLSAAAPPQKLLFGDKNFRFVTKAKDADVVVISAQRFDEYPDLHVTDTTFKTPTKVTDGGVQKDAFLWGSAETFTYRNMDGVPLQAALYKPENFDPKKKYPLIVYIYEKLAENAHNFVNPSPGTSINFSYYTSNGYLVLTPDIVYEIGKPGHSALRCVLPALQSVVDRGYVDEKALGIQGHSWGGYQIAYMLTQTDRFKAAEAGAAVGNMTSAYSGIRWGTGLPRQFQYEQTQSRIGPTLYDSPLLYFQNSPIFQIKNVKTPVLIIHNDNDDAVPWYQGIELFLALRRNGKEAYMLNYNGEYHGLRRRFNQKDYTRRMAEFFDHYLRGAAKPAWMEKGVPYIEREEEKLLRAPQ